MATETERGVDDDGALARQCRLQKRNDPVKHDRDVTWLLHRRQPCRPSAISTISAAVSTKEAPAENAITATASRA
ncbi:hypothetical protein GCM10009668_10250 [Nocardioides dubius]|uniref:Uncharacterized protein n=1 Tax=Nocardioides dubius TaxID=317019 RepID=A0ABP4EAC1_9ACTN